TIAQLSGLLKVQRKDAVIPPVTKQPRPENIPLSFSQERLWFLDQLEGSKHYHIPTVLRLKGDLNKEALQFALQTIVNRHEVLRSVIIEKEGHGSQRVLDQDLWKLDITNDENLEFDPHSLINYVKALISKPFDLSKDHMLRANLVVLGQQEYLLVATMHHIASDGWSLSILVEELVELYRSYVENRPAVLLPLELQYADYAIWQRQYITGEMLDQKLNYWKQKLDGVAPLQLPIDFARPAIQGNKGDVAGFSLDEELSKKLIALSQKQGATLFMTMLAAFKVLLYRYSGQPDFCVGTPIANRSQQDLEKLIGFFLNTLALRTTVEENITFTDYLEQVKTTTLEGFQNQDVAFEKVVDAVMVQRDASRTPLFQVMFVLQNTPDVPHLQLGQLELSQEPSRYVSVKFEITLSIRETASGFVGNFEYSSDLYCRETIDRMIANFKKLLSSIVANPNESIAVLPILDTAEQDLVLNDFNNTVAGYPKDKSIVSLFEEQVAKTPAATAIVFKDEQFTYQQLNVKANQFAHYLQAKGVKAEMLVPICIEQGVEMIIGLLGILKAGAAFVPIDPDSPVERINFQVKDTKATILVTNKKVTSRVAAFNSVEVIKVDEDWEEIKGQSTGNVATHLLPTQLAYVIYTSGSTGTPKGVMVEHRSIVNYLTNNKTRYINEDTDTTGTFSYLTYTFDASLTALFMPLLSGKSVVLGTTQSVEVFDDPNFQKFAPYDFLKVTPAHLQLLQPFIKKDNKDSLTNRLVIGGEALHAGQFDFFRKENWDVEIINEYGPTEAAVGCSTFSFNTLKDKDQIQGEVPIGKPVDNTQLYILDSSNNIVPIGITGELHIGGAGLARGYLNLPELTAERFIQNPFSKETGCRLYKTGDLGRWLPDGNIEYMGRIDDQVKIRGYRIELGEIEGVVLQSGLVRQAVVIARQEA
ncbi:MAG TPA: amino acid adenylation domain-containing protein, partial [Segetibacter sp.]